MKETVKKTVCRFAAVCAFGFLGMVSTQTLASPSYLTGAELKTQCSSKFDTDYGMCAGFVTAVADVLLTQQVDNIRACHKSTIRTQQLMGIVTTYINKHPDSAHAPARTVVAQALARAFPCL